ncbi:GGDEF domain-containing protein [Vibrio azureus]|uniref:diguanylate cyclase n=1 Tax=Vibrio azureus NBRC 104587 TaxID=1219077 RepID=U3BZK5_9VIBR|nr:GGDEF domain-containing protein [Vibrio azureus]AUI87773.1 GGDEF domain-containing protein [Vibrio azureus]GAD74724.1 hypothetical protein VAZ01S_014_00120 [Vibrio azureus NBRC 104587]
MEKLLKKVTGEGLDPASVTGEEAIILWQQIQLNIASTDKEKAHCYFISAEYRSKLKQLKESITELRLALELLKLPEDVDDVLSIKASLSERLVDLGHYNLALAEYTSSISLAVEHGCIESYVLAVLGMGNLCDAYGDHQRALRYYHRIDAIAHAISHRPLKLKYHLFILACHINLKQFTQASFVLNQCEELSTLVSDKNLTGQVLLYRAKLYRLQKDYQQALLTLSRIQYDVGNHHTHWLSTMVKLEISYSLNKVGHTSLSNMLLASIEKRINEVDAPLVAHCFYNARSKIFATQKDFQQALNYEKKAFRIESELVKNIPISDLGPAQLRRLTRFELQLKLILSEIENKELKETTLQHKNAVAQLQQDALTDPLTSLHNRRWLELKVKKLRLKKSSFALLVIDIDHFKLINDELSHLIGDKVIRQVSKQLTHYFHFPNCHCIRFGGEEFLVILENTSLAQASIHAEHYRTKIHQFDWHTILGERDVTVSIGVTLHRQGENTQRTFYRADQALYRAKSKGRNQICSES